MQRAMPYATVMTLPPEEVTPLGREDRVRREGACVREDANHVVRREEEVVCDAYLVEEADKGEAAVASGCGEGDVDELEAAADEATHEEQEQGCLVEDTGHHASSPKRTLATSLSSPASPERTKITSRASRVRSSSTAWGRARRSSSSSDSSTARSSAVPSGRVPR